MFKYFRNFFGNSIGIDLGTANTLVFVREHGIIINEPSVVAVDADTNEVRAVGIEAKRMLGRTPGNIRAIRPMKDGVIADFDISEHMLRYFITKANGSGSFWKPRVLIAVPYGITPVEEKSVRDSAKSAGADEVHLMYEPMASALGVGLPVNEPLGSMIVDIGGGTTEVAVISLGGIVECRSVKSAGDAMDNAIINHMKRAHSLLIGERTAETIKVEIGSAYRLEKELEMEVKGRDLMGGLPKGVRINSIEIREALTEPINKIVEAVRTTLERCPPELSSDLIDHGIVLAGGGALVRNIDRLLSEETGLPVSVSENPLQAVVNGCGIYLQNIDSYSSLTLPKF